MNLPKRTTTQELRARLNDYELRLKDIAPLPEPIIEARYISVEGGAVESEGSSIPAVRGYIAVTVDRTRINSTLKFNPKWPIIHVTYEWRTSSSDRGPLRVRTTPGMLVAVNGRWIPNSVQSDPSVVHEIILPKVESVLALKRMVLSFAVPDADLFVIGPVLPAAKISASKLFRYAILPSATEVFGEGTVLYNTGHKISVNLTTPVPLLRPTETGALGRVPGSVFAEFRGANPAYTRIGSAWFLTPPI